MRSRRFTADATTRPLAPIEHNVVHDQAFNAGFAEHVLTPWLIAETARQPFTRDECISVDAEGGIERLRRAALAGRLRVAGSHSLARQVERALVLDGSTLVVVVGDPTRVATIVTRRAELDPAPPPGPRDLVTRHAPGEPWRHGRWVAPIPSSHVHPRRGGG